MTQSPKHCIYEGLIFNNAFYFIRCICLNAESESQGEKQNSPTLHLQLSLMTMTFEYLDLYQFHPGYSRSKFSLLQCNVLTVIFKLLCQKSCHVDICQHGKSGPMKHLTC